ncbi:winged helix-turn-helix domain-containing protein [Thermococcus sp.]|uniref:winged helix-turn-helix domain-containing protein n=1 Tax=Thermococcus sp. TaxID=35749 RepID=UPI00261D0484|nr:winged helix-turn-helix domain-containing protein [Thermococcus sp.]
MRRSRVEIIADILESANGRGATKTQIVYRANLNFKLATGYIKYLLEKGYLVEAVEGSRRVYRVTDKGRAFLRSFLTIYRELDDFDSIDIDGF